MSYFYYVDENTGRKDIEKIVSESKEKSYIKLLFLIEDGKSGKDYESQISFIRRELRDIPFSLDFYSEKSI